MQTEIAAYWHAREEEGRRGWGGGVGLRAAGGGGGGVREKERQADRQRERKTYTDRQYTFFLNLKKKNVLLLSCLGKTEIY